MNRPYVICHMVTSLDGKVTGDFLYDPACHAATETYYEINRAFAADAFACGRVTMEGSFTGGWYPELEIYEKILSREDYLADAKAGFFAVSFDRRGRLGWQGTRIVDEDPGYGNAHIIEVLCEELVDGRYLAYLQSIGVSYIFAGKFDLDLSFALRKLKALFGIEKLLLEGGSILNGAFRRQGLVDELSLVVAPMTAGEGKPLFTDSTAMPFSLIEVSQREQGVLWLRYRKERMV